MLGDGLWAQQTRLPTKKDQNDILKKTRSVRNDKNDVSVRENVLEQCDGHGDIRRVDEVPDWKNMCALHAHHLTLDVRRVVATRLEPRRP